MDTKKIAIAISSLKANTAQHILESEGIPCFLLDKRDSSYAMAFGQIELHVPEEMADRAKKILKDEGVLED